MLKIAVMTDTAEENAVVSASFAEASFLLLFDAENGEMLRAIPREQKTDADMANLMVEMDCEAVITGPIEEEPFVIIADKGCITRYNGVGRQALDALEDMNRYYLALIPDYIGGHGCEPGNEENCKQHNHG